MSNAQMTASVQCFWSRVDDANKKLKLFSHDVRGREDKVDALLKNMVRDSRMNFPRKIEVGDAVQEKLIESLRHFENVISDWTECIQEAKKGQEFIHENEKHMLVMVFGKVKTGKSSLGNFLAGKSFVNSIFPNEYKRRYSTTNAQPCFKIEIQGREDNLEGGWFREGVTDATGAIQHFTIPGLRWIDSPGTGAVQKEGDTCDMEQLVREYLNYADLGVFLMSSDAPGLQPDFEYINRLQENGKPAIVVITKSDRNDEKIVNGKIVSNWVAKTTEDRQDQENWIREELVRNGVQDRFRVLSISTYLAIRGIETQDDDVFRQSQLDLFMEALGEKIGEEAVQLKERNPKENINRLIREILQGVEGDDKRKGFKGSQSICQDFASVFDFIVEHQCKLRELEGFVVQKVKAKANLEIINKLTKLSNQVEQQNVSFSREDVSRIIVDVLHRILTEELDKAISQIISNFSNERLKISIKLQTDADLGKKQETIEQKIVHYSQIERKPDGFIESIRAFFGKEYYRTERTEVIRHVTFDVGTNLQEVLDRILEMVDNQVKLVVHDELQRIAKEYFTPQEAYVRSIQEQLQKFQFEIGKLKYSLQ